jgi:Fe-S-cluster-containing dehydrogenase component
MRPAILTDLTKCVGCKACVWACKEVNELPRDGSPPAPKPVPRNHDLRRP